MKRLCPFIISLLCIALFLPSPALASREDEILEETQAQLDGYDLNAWQSAADSFSGELDKLWDGASMREWMLDYAAGNVDTNYGGVLNKAKEAVIHAIRENASMLCTLFGISILTGVVGVIFDGERGLREILALICAGMAISAAAAFFLRLIAEAQRTIEQIAAFALQAVPVLSTMLTAAGNVASAGMLRPLMVFLSGSVIVFFTDFVLPAITAAGLLAIAGSLCGRDELRKFAKLLKSLCKWSIGLVFTVYLGTLSLQGMSLAGADSIGLRTIKYTLDKSIPVIGGAVSGTLDTVRACAVLVKNAAGAATVLMTLAYTLEPAVKIAAAAFTLKICAALCAPVSDGKIAAMIEDIGELCSYVLSAVLSAALMFVILAGMCMALGNR